MRDANEVADEICRRSNAVAEGVPFDLAAFIRPRDAEVAEEIAKMVQQRSPQLRATMLDAVEAWLGTQQGPSALVDQLLGAFAAAIRARFGKGGGNHA